MLIINWIEFKFINLMELIMQFLKMTLERERKMKLKSNIEQSERLKQIDF